MRSVFTHEFGHTLLLDDVDPVLSHPDTDCLMFPNIQSPPIFEPQSCDFGANPFVESGVDFPCNDISKNWGLRCVFGWWREQGTQGQVNQVDCHDLNRDGIVDLPNDILGTVLAFTEGSGEGERAPSQYYRPEADSNRDGVVDLPNDILGTVLDFGVDPGHCESAHYPNA